MTECIATEFDFHPLRRREVIGRFDGGAITSDAGGLLLRELEAKTGLLQRFSDGFTDHRVPELVTQRVFGLCLGYEDLNDHDELRRIVGRIRASWPRVRIVIRGDSGFCREEIMRWCERNGVDFLLGLAKNNRLKAEIIDEMQRAKTAFERSGTRLQRFRVSNARQLESTAPGRRQGGVHCQRREPAVRRHVAAAR